MQWRHNIIRLELSSEDIYARIYPAEHAHTADAYITYDPVPACERELCSNGFSIRHRHLRLCHYNFHILILSILKGISIHKVH